MILQVSASDCVYITNLLFKQLFRNIKITKRSHESAFNTYFSLNSNKYTCIHSILLLCKKVFLNEKINLQTI